MRFGYLLSILFTGVLSGCVTYSSYQMDVLRPATITIPPHVKSVMVIDNSYPTLDSVEVDITTNISYVSHIPVVFDSSSSIAMKQLVAELNMRQFFDTVYLAPETLNGKFGYRHKPFSFPQLHTNADSLKVDGVVVFNNYTYHPALNYSHLIENDYFMCNQSVRFVVDWVFVDLIENRVIDQYVHVDTLYWKGVSGDYSYPVIGVPTLTDAIAETAEYMGFYHADRLTPYGENVSRYFYTYGAGYYPEADACVEQNQWAKAEKVWFFIYKNAKGIRKAQLAHNIALAKEVQSQFDDAARWAHHSWQLFSDRSSSQSATAKKEKEYYLELIKRIDDAKKLGLQYGNPVQ